MKKLLALLILLLLFAQTTIFATSLAEETQRVFDYAGLLTVEQCNELQELITDYQTLYKIDIVIVTITDAQGKSSRDFADDFYDYNGFGVGADKDGLLLLIDMDNRMLYISTCGSMISLLYDTRIDELLDIQYNYVVEGQYFAGLLASLKQIGFYLELGPDLPIHIPEKQPTFSINPLWVLASLFIGSIIASIVVSRIKQSYDQGFATLSINYNEQAKLNLETQVDNLIDKKVTSQYIPPSPSPSGISSIDSSSSSFSSSNSSHSSSTHSSSSGTTHGGGGRSF